MKFKALKNFSSIRWGNVKVGDLIELQKDTARQMIDSGMVELTPVAADQLRQKQLQEAQEKARLERDTKAKK